MHWNSSVLPSYIVNSFLLLVLIDKQSSIKVIHRIVVRVAGIPTYDNSVIVISLSNIIHDN